MMASFEQWKLRRPILAFGPEMPGWGSWHWVGEDLLQQLEPTFHTRTFRFDQVPTSDVLIIVKHVPPETFLRSIPAHFPILFCPVDYYGTAAEIDADAPFLRRCSRIIVHCERLRRYFEPYAPVVYLDHHVKFVAPLRTHFQPHGFFLWVGVRTNLPPLVEYVNAHPLPGALRILTNFESPQQPIKPADVGFHPGMEVCLEEWTPRLQSDWTFACRAALDIKGDDFRARHKPPAKAIDFLASGVPLALNPYSSPADHLALMGLAVATPNDRSRWLSLAYWQDVQRFGSALRELLSLPRLALRWTRILNEILAEHCTGAGLS